MTSENEQTERAVEGNPQEGERSGNRRRNRRRGKKRPAETPSSEERATNPAVVANSEQQTANPTQAARTEERAANPTQAARTEERAANPTQAARTEERAANPSKPPRQQQQKQRPQQEQKKPQEPRPPRGSVLQRRSSRPEPTFMKEQEDLPVPAKTPVAANSVDEYVKHLHGWQREVVSILRNIVRNASPDSLEGILWSQPVYSLNGPVVYIKAFSDHVNIGFWRGNEISDPDVELVGELPTMRHLTIRHINELKREAIERMVRQAFKLSKERGDATA